MSRNDPQPLEAELAALADGTLTDAELEARVAADPELAARLAEQRRAVALLQAAAAQVDAPAGLRARVDARRSRRAPRRFVLGAGVAAAAVVAAVVALTLPGGPGAPSVAQAARLTVLPPTEPAPPPRPAQPKLLAASEGGVPFPNFEAKFGWRATGERAQKLRDRHTTTVYYRRGGKRIGYVILDGPPLPLRGAVTKRGGVDFHVTRQGGRSVVSWLRLGRTCVISGPGVPTSTLLTLASWKGKGAVHF
jgi:hypothetical protein